MLIEAFSAVVGAGCWEIFRQASSVLIKRKSDKEDTRRKILREQLGGAVKLVTACVEAAEDYYTSDPKGEGRDDLSKKLRRAGQQLYTAVHQINVGLAENEMVSGLDSDLIIKFRQSLTWRLNDATLPQLTEDDPLVSNVMRRGFHLIQVLTKLQYKLA